MGAISIQEMPRLSQINHPMQIYQMRKSRNRMPMFQALNRVNPLYPLLDIDLRVSLPGFRRLQNRSGAAVQNDMDKSIEDHNFLAPSGWWLQESTAKGDLAFYS